MVDFLRSAARVPTKVYHDSDELVPIRWVKARPGAPLLGIPTAFAHRVWDGGQVPVTDLGGADLPGTWAPTNDAAILADAVARVGNDAVFLTGVPYSCGEEVVMCCRLIAIDNSVVSNFPDQESLMYTKDFGIGELTHNGDAIRADWITSWHNAMNGPTRINVYIQGSLAFQTSPYDSFGFPWVAPTFLTITRLSTTVLRVFVWDRFAPDVEWNDVAYDPTFPLTVDVKVETFVPVSANSQRRFTNLRWVKLDGV